MAQNKDLFLDILANPNLNLEDLVSVGHSAENTRFLDKDKYEASERVRLKFTDSEGNFKQKEFDDFYQMAAMAYSTLTDKELNKSIINKTIYDADNIWVDPSLRKRNSEPVLTLDSNPDRLKKNIFRVGRISERDRSISELAQAEKVLMNPVGVANGEDPIYSDAPNDSWWSKFWDVNVLAQYDEDEYDDQGNLIHQKGEYKLNDNGTYYYEALDGRDIYGKQVLNKFDTITTDGSFWNQYDFMDSDDIQAKSVGGSLMKNLALVGSMFIPVVGWGVAAASVANQLTGLSGTLGKMLTGSESPTFSYMEGLSKSFDRRSAKTEESQQKMLTWENFIDLIGDTAAQLREQRAIFKFVPAILKGKYGVNQTEAGHNLLASEIAKDLESKTDIVGKTNWLKIMLAARKSGNPTKTVEELIGGAKGIIAQAADKQARDYFTSYNKIGEQVARAYMTAITVADTYGEAKEAGASDLEATLLTIGYGAAEDRLLRTEIGRWIMPELRADRQRFKLIGQALTKLPKETRELSKSLKSQPNETKKEWAKRLFSIGKDICNAEYATATKSLKSVIANGLSEGVEEVSEEALADFSKSCFNVVQQLQGDDVRMDAFNHNWDWQEALKRYGMNFAGGVLGGAINSAASDYSQLRSLSNMSHKEAVELLVWMERNGEIDEFWNTIQNQEIANSKLSTRTNEDGTWKVGTKDDNQDLEAKRAIKANIDIIHDLMQAEGASLSDSGLIGQVMNINPKLKAYDLVGQFRANALAKSVTAGALLNRYNKLCAEIIKLQHDIKTSESDSDKKSETPADSSLRSKKAKLKQKQEEKEAILNGEYSAEFYRDALFETNFGVSEQFVAPTEVQFSELKSGKKWVELTPEEKEKLKEDYANWSKSGDRYQLIHDMAMIYWNMATQSSAALQLSHDLYLQLNSDKLQRLKALNKFADAKLSLIDNFIKSGDDNSIDNIQALLNHVNDLKAEIAKTSFVEGSADPKLSNFQAALSNSDKYQEELNAIANDSTLSDEEKLKRGYDSALTNIFNELLLVANESVKSGYIHPEVKRILVPAMQRLSSTAMQYSGDTYMLDEDLSTKYEELSNTIDDVLSEINNLAYTPIIANLKSFATSIGVDGNVLQVIENAITKEKDSEQAIDNLSLDNSDLKLYEEAEQVLKLYRATIAGARVDSADLEDMFGYNKTLNQVATKLDGYVPLVEIDSQTADLAFLDINKALQRLEINRGIHELNTGNKLNSLKKVSVNKNLILFNKSRSFIQVLLNDDDDALKAKWNGTGNALAKLQDAINSMSTHKDNWADNIKDRKLSLSPDQKENLERESIALDNALYDFFQDNLLKYKDGTGKIDYKAFSEDLALLFDKVNFRLFRNNDEILKADSKDINDTAFVYWLASKATLKDDNFYNEFRQIISDETDEHPIAPIPTLELGIFAAIAAITNGNMFTAFGNALRKHMTTKWEGMSQAQREETIRENKLPETTYYKDEDIKKGLFNDSDLIPKFTNILFIEGIPGSGKSSGVYNSIIKVLNRINPTIATKEDGTEIKLLDRGIILAHSTQENADHLKGNLAFEEGTKVTTFGKKDLLNWIGEYNDTEDPITGEYKYVIRLDAYVDEGGVIRSMWKLKEKDPNEVPSVLFIDEWSQYNQLEADLVQRFAQKYGIQVIASGDLDLINPRATLYDNKDYKENDNTFDITLARTMTPAIPKLGVSMRTGNGQMTYNLSSLQTWYRNKTTDPVQLKYVETDQGLYGTKVYNQDGKLTENQLTKLKHDIQKMIDTLKDGQKIGYIYSDTDSELYKWALDDSRKDYFDFKSDKSAQGMESLYYVVENNRALRYKTKGADGKIKEKDRPLDDYFKSVYTGISRAELGSIVIAPVTAIKGFKLENPATQETEVIPDNYSSEGIKRFAKERKDLLNKIYNGTSIDPISYIPRETFGDTPHKVEDTDSGSLLEPIKVTPGTETSPDESLDETGKPETEPKSDEESEPSEKEKEEPEKEDGKEPTSYKGKYLPGTELWNPKTGRHIGTVIGMEDDSTYKMKSPGGFPFLSSASVVDKHVTVKPVIPAKFKVGDTFFNPVTGEKCEIIETRFDAEQNLTYHTLRYPKGDTITYDDSYILEKIAKGLLTLPPVINTDEGAEVADNYLTVENQEEYESALEEGLQKEAEALENKEEKVVVNGEDIDFTLTGETFNTQYTGLRFKDGKPIVDYSRGGKNRIDNGHGLLKINKTAFGSEEAILKALGELRSIAMFQNNSDIETLFRRVLKLGEEPIKIKWAFISKSQSPRTENNKYSRYFYDPSEQLINMLDEKKAKVPIKTIAAVVFDKNNNPILELPMLTLGNPLTIVYKLGQINPGHPVATAFNRAMAIEKGKSIKDKSILNVLEAIQDAINKQPGSHPNLDRLNKLCELWKFTSNGFKFLPEDWNLSDNSKNLGSHYVKQRQTEESIIFNDEGNGKYDMKPAWHELTSDQEMQRNGRDVWYSSIMMSNVTNHAGVPIFPAGHPFILRSDDYRYNSDEKMMRRYLQLMHDKSLTPIVKLEPISPPQTSIVDYLQKVLEITSNKTDEGHKIINHYGNDLTPLKLLVAASYDPSLFNRIKGGLKGEIQELVDGYKSITISPKEGESRSSFMSRLFAARASLVNEGNIEEIRNKLNKALMDICSSNVIAGDDKPVLRDGSHGDSNEVVRLVKLAEEKLGMTGVLARLHEVNSDGFRPIAGYGYLIKTDPLNKYAFEDGRSFRVYSKFDSPKYDMTSLLDTLGKFADDADNSRSPQKFRNKKDEEDYLAVGKTSESNIESNKLKFTKKHKDVINKLAKLGLNIDNIAENVATEQLFLQEVLKVYTTKPGNIGIIVGDNILLGNLINEDLTSTTKFPEEYKDLLQKGFEKDTETGAEDGYILKMAPVGGKIMEIRLEVEDINSGKYKVIFEGKAASKSNTPDLTTLSNYAEAIDSYMNNYCDPSQPMYEVLNKAHDIIINATRNGLNPIEIIKNSTDFDTIDLMTISLAMTNEENPSIFDEIDLTELESEICPIVIVKKFI